MVEEESDVLLALLLVSALPILLLDQSSLIVDAQVHLKLGRRHFEAGLAGANCTAVNGVEFLVLTDTDSPVMRGFSRGDSPCIGHGRLRHSAPLLGHPGCRLPITQLIQS